MSKSSKSIDNIQCITECITSDYIFKYSTYVLFNSKPLEITFLGTDYYINLSKVLVLYKYDVIYSLKVLLDLEIRQGCFDYLYFKDKQHLISSINFLISIQDLKRFHNIN